MADEVIDYYEEIGIDRHRPTSEILADIANRHDTLERALDSGRGGDREEAELGMLKAAMSVFADEASRASYDARLAASRPDPVNEASSRLIEQANAVEDYIAQGEIEYAHFRVYRDIFHNDFDANAIRGDANISSEALNKLIRAIISLARHLDKSEMIDGKDGKELAASYRQSANLLLYSGMDRYKNAVSLRYARYCLYSDLERKDEDLVSELTRIIEIEGDSPTKYSAFAQHELARREIKEYRSSGGAKRATRWEKLVAMSDEQIKAESNLSLPDMEIEGDSRNADRYLSKLGSIAAREIICRRILGDGSRIGREAKSNLSWCLDQKRYWQRLPDALDVVRSEAQLRMRRKQAEEAAREEERRKQAEEAARQERDRELVSTVIGIVCLIGIGIVVLRWLVPLIASNWLIIVIVIIAIGYFYGRKQK